MTAAADTGATPGRRGVWAVVYLTIAALAVAAPLALPALTTQFTFLWIMIVFAVTWDITGGRMGYNSFGNVLFVGIGMYTTAVVQVAPFFDITAYTQAQGAAGFDLSVFEYHLGLAAGLVAGGLLAMVAAAVLGVGMLSLRGQYFAIGTLGLGVAAAEIAAGWSLIGAGSGMVTPLYPGDQDARALFFYGLAAVLGLVVMVLAHGLASSRLGLVLTAIRDDEDKAEAMGLGTMRFKTAAWCLAALFLGMAGGILGNVVGFIDPRDVAFSTATFGVWMVLMAVLGGKGTVFGPVVGAVIFHITQELFWTYLLGWQRVALGLLIVVTVVFFPQGVLGFVRSRFPALFGISVDAAPAATPTGDRA